MDDHHHQRRRQMRRRRPPPPPKPSATFSGGFSGGFEAFAPADGSRDAGDFADVTVRLQPSGDAWRLHSLLLARGSEFFRRALAGSSGFSEARSGEVELRLEAAAEEAAWPALVRYFYTDSVSVDEDTAPALLALSRRLLVAPLSAFVGDFIAAHLDERNCLAVLRRAVEHHAADVAERAVALAARNFHRLFDARAAVAGLPPGTVLELLQHPELLAHCEEMVLRFVGHYLASTALGAADALAVAQEVRYVFLDNSRLAGLATTATATATASPVEATTATSSEGAAAAAASGGAGGHAGGHAATLLPRELLLAGAMARLQSLDRPGLDLAALKPPPRDCFCCNEAYGLPGGSRFLTLPIEDVWEELARTARVRVSGPPTEGAPRNLLRGEPDAFFESDESSPPHLPWVQVTLPRNCRVVRFDRYTFAHGHRRSAYFRLRNWATLVSSGSGGGGSGSSGGSGSGGFVKVVARPAAAEHNSMLIGAAEQHTPWRSLRLQGTDRQEDGVYRLCLRNLRVYGLLEVDLLRQGRAGGGGGGSYDDAEEDEEDEEEDEEEEGGGGGPLVLTAELVGRIKAAQAARREAAAAAAAAAPPTSPGAAGGGGGSDNNNNPNAGGGAGSSGGGGGNTTAGAAGGWGPRHPYALQQY